MQKFETQSLVEARRLRMAQYSGQSRQLTICGAPVTGIVQSVMNVEAEGSEPRKWIVHIKPARAF